MDFWTHNKTMYPYSVYQKSSVYFSLNIWTHGLLDTQQNSLCLSSIWKAVCAYILLKSLDRWSFGHTPEQRSTFKQDCKALHIFLLSVQMTMCPVILSDIHNCLLIFWIQIQYFVVCLEVHVSSDLNRYTQ